MFQNFTAEQLREIVEEIARVLETCLTVYAFGGAVMVFEDDASAFGCRIG